MHARLQQARFLRTRFMAFQLEGRVRPSRGERPLTTVVPAAEARGCVVTKQAAAIEEAAGYPRRAILMCSRGLPRPAAVDGDIRGGGGVHIRSGGTPVGGIQRKTGLSDQA